MSKNPHAVALGRRGGRAGTGDSKRRQVTPEQARRAAQIRWARHRKAIKSAAPVAILIFLCLACHAQTNTARIAFAFRGGPILPNPLDSYCAVVVTGAVNLASQQIVLEASTNAITWAPIATNAIVAFRGRFWLSNTVDLAWTVFYDYRWRERPNRFYRLSHITGR